MVDENFGDTWEWDGSRWKLRSESGPEPRHHHAMVFDAARGETLLFGGNTGSVLGDTWGWDGESWTLRDESGPWPRWGHAMAYDSARGVVVFFGGHYAGSSWNDTWEWDGQGWELRAEAGPEGRHGHVLAYDERAGVTLLHGGARKHGGDYDDYLWDTWSWDGRQWTRIDTLGPPPRAWHSITYDAARERAVLFGGYFGYSESIAYTEFFVARSFYDQWEIGPTGQWVARPTTCPGPRYGHAMAYDSKRDVTVLFGGFDHNSVGFHIFAIFVLLPVPEWRGDCRGALNLYSTWESDGEAWQMVHRGYPKLPDAQDSAVPPDGPVVIDIAEPTTPYPAFYTLEALLQQQLDQTPHRETREREPTTAPIGS